MLADAGSPGSEITVGYVANKCHMPLDYIIVGMWCSYKCSNSSSNSSTTAAVKIAQEPLTWPPGALSLAPRVRTTVHHYYYYYYYYYYYCYY